MGFRKPENLVLALAGVMTCAGVADAALVTLSDRNATATFNVDSTIGFPNGMINWTINGQDQLVQQWFWIRTGNAGGEVPINVLQLNPTVSVSNTNFNAGNDRLVVTYVGNGLEVRVDYSLSGGRTGGGANVGETISIKNLSGVSQTYSFFQYSDFNLNNNPAADQVVITANNTADQTNGMGSVTESVLTPQPTRFEADAIDGVNDLLARLNDGAPTTLNNNPIAVGNGTWAFQWDFNLPAGGTFAISKVKTITVIPEPAAGLLLLAGGVGLMLRRGRRE